MKDKRELFEGTAQYYSRYRKGYPEKFFEFIVTEFNLNKSSKVLDLGVGTGQIAIPLASIVSKIVAVDPDQELLEEGKRIAKEKGIANIDWVKLKAEDISDNLGQFDLTVMGASFHWMDREKVLTKVYEITKNDGGVVIVSESNLGGPPNWKELRKKIILKYLGEKRRAGNSFYERGDDKFEDRLTDSPFGDYEEWHYEFEREWTLDEVVNFLYSTSFASKRLFGDRLDDFDKELRSGLVKLEPSGIFKEKVRTQALISRKLLE